MQETVAFERYKYVGGSDIPVIMSLSPFKTRWQLLKEKAQIEESEFQGNIYTEYGNTMEPFIRDYINEALGFDFQEGKAYGDGIRIHVDGEDILKDTILEVKTTSHVYDDLDEYKTYLVQLLFYMNERGFNNGLLAVYKRPDDLNTVLDPDRLMTYPIVKADYQELVKEIYEELDLFRRDLEKVKENPFITEEELLPDDVRLLARRLINLKEAELMFKDVTAEKDIIVSKLGQRFTEEKRKTAEIGGYKVTYTPAKEKTVKLVKELDLDLLKSTYAETYDKCLKEVEKTTNARKASFTLTRKEG